MATADVLGSSLCLRVSVVGQLCAPLANRPDYIRAVELAPGWSAAEVAAVTREGLTVALAGLTPAQTTPEALAELLAGVGAGAIDSLVLPAQPLPADEAAAGERLVALADVAAAAGVTLLLQNAATGWPAHGAMLGQVVAALAHPGLQACYDPAEAVRLRRHPFLSDLMAGPLKRQLRCLRLRDARFRDGQPVPPHEGNAELRELVSALECRSYGGWYALDEGLGNRD